MVYDNASPPGLGNLLSQRSQVISFDNVTHSFWPRRSFDDLFTSEAISAELWPPDERPSAEASLANARSRKLLVAFIREKSKKIFAILLTCLKSGGELRQAINHFRNAGLDDSCLPVTTKDIKSRIFYKPGNSSEYREPWSGFGEKNFCEVWQWKFNAPVFNPGQSLWILHHQTILPFTKVNSRGKEGSGKFVSIKKLYRPETDDRAKLQDLERSWQQEVFAHEELVKCGHRNIIKFIAGITKGNDRYLMCEWANGGNLREFWTKNEPNLTRTLVKDVIVQLQGITSALKMIHSKNFRHGDLKPENIVRQEMLSRNSGSSRLDVGELKICDMGLTKYHVEATEFRNRSTDTRFSTYRYEPPEALPFLRHQPWSRRFDIWSIGCIILEFIVWMLEGPKGLKEFNGAILTEFGREDQYFEWEKRRDRQIVFYIHKVVEQKMKSLSSHRVCRAGNTALSDLLAIVETRLLVVDLASADPRSPIRADSASLKEEIDKIVERGSRYPDYWLQGKTREDVPILHPATAVAPVAT
ncbi:hypothetical protein E8E14_009269 [Neopestalotiopsis sp. 37M]|nr:hypothetical protein E8E14_009269 [Neopestalotiopsis sp. 37M]